MTHPDVFVPCHRRLRTKSNILKTLSSALTDLANLNAPARELRQQFGNSGRSLTIAWHNHSPRQVFPELFVANFPFLKLLRLGFANLHHRPIPRQCDCFPGRAPWSAQNIVSVS